MKSFGKVLWLFCIMLGMNVQAFAKRPQRETRFAQALKKTRQAGVATRSWIMENKAKVAVFVASLLAGGAFVASRGGKAKTSSQELSDSDSGSGSESDFGFGFLFEEKKPRSPQGLRKGIHTIEERLLSPAPKDIKVRPNKDKQKIDEFLRAYENKNLTERLNVVFQRAKFSQSLTDVGRAILARDIDAATQDYQQLQNAALAAAKSEIDETVSQFKQEFDIYKDKEIVGLSGGLANRYREARDEMKRFLSDHSRVKHATLEQAAEYLVQFEDLKSRVNQQYENVKDNLR